MSRGRPEPNFRQWEVHSELFFKPRIQYKHRPERRGGECDPPPLLVQMVRVLRIGWDASRILASMIQSQDDYSKDDWYKELKVQSRAQMPRPKWLW